MPSIVDAMDTHSGTETNADTDDNAGIEDKARALLEGRLNSVRTLASTVERLDQARAAVAAAEKANDDAWSEATNAGWTTAELAQLGFTAPKSKGGRARSTSRRRATSTRPAGSVHS